MTWTTLSLSTKANDLSIYQNLKRNTTDPASGRVDFFTMASENPEIKLVISRAAGSFSGIDPDFQHNYDQSGLAGFLQAPYVNINPSKSLSDLEDWWKRALDDRNPQLFILDCETSAEKSRSQITAHIQDCLELLHQNWPNAVVIMYTAAWWWNPNVVHGWEGNELFWLAHYPFFTQEEDGDWRTVWTFDEIDPLLPIHNSFTPRIPTGVNPANVVGWQFSDKMIIEPISKPPKDLPRADGDYFTNAFVDMAFDLDVPEPPPPQEPIAVEVIVKAGEAEVTVTEV